MKNNMIILMVALSISFLACNNNSNHSNAEEKETAISGEQLFKINCAQCHRPTEDLTGPALRNVANRWKDKTMLYEFIKNPQEVIVKDAYAKDLFAKWKQAYMQPFPNLSNEEIDGILKYCNEEK
ncbi:MAG: cytochrome c [Ferruginibacter sp.]